ncbi:hypothetical protein ACS8E9_18875 [Pseudomonas neustonica]|uniref:hypothetical protein n=1 Tax=Pseudomonas neustonica TaxID=2487346 RepID=UPI003F483081
MIRQHHFAHHSNKESCNIQRESLLHLYAKEVIREASGLQLPPLPGVLPESEDTSSWWDFETVEAEVAQPGFQPDLVASLRDGNELFIEVAVTSFIGESKRKRIEARGVLTVELDLRMLMLSDHSLPSAYARAYILNEVRCKTWIWPVGCEVMTEPALVPEIIDQSPPSVEINNELRFTVFQMWVSARTLPSGAIAVRSWTYNPQVVELLKSWRNELGGEYNAKFRNWIFASTHRDEILAKLRALDEN